MKCVRDGCGNNLTPSQVYEFLRGKTKGNCSRKCGGKSYADASCEPNREKKCIVCGNYFRRKEAGQTKKAKVCGTKCAGVLSSDRMKKNNPMMIDEYRQKSINTLKKIGHMPYQQGGNGRGLTKWQSNIYSELCKHDDSFSVEYIEKTGRLKKMFNAPNHYKIDIASAKHKLAIEIDGKSHQTKKVQQCDQRKTQLLTMRGWKVLRFTNSQIENELMSCVQKVLSMTSH